MSEMRRHDELDYYIRVDIIIDCPTSIQPFCHLSQKYILRTCSRSRVGPDPCNPIVVAHPMLMAGLE